MPGEEAGGIQPGNRLPRLELIEARDGGTRVLPEVSRDALILLILPAAYQEWTAYLAAMNRAADAVRQWDARILIVMTGELDVAPEVSRHSAPDLTVLLEADAAVHRRLGIQPGFGALVIVDRYGQIYDFVQAEREDELPDPAEVEEWAKYLATQCPECGVIDEPGHGEWSLT